VCRFEGTLVAASGRRSRLRYGPIVNPRRSRRLLALVMIALSGATGVAAAAKPGWEVKRTVSHGPYTAIDSARRCGASEFGKYTLRLAYAYTAGPLTGETVHVVVTFALRDDRRRHRFHFVSVSGTAIGVLSPADRGSVKRALAAAFSDYSIEVLRVLKGPRLTTRLWNKQKVVSTGVLGLQRTRC
ncbi:MAG: hypothetical protein M3065_11840, partial [Actinomycetota bacterium]|nr:hypothetical protein [Actinomycetota bacterium]